MSIDPPPTSLASPLYPDLAGDPDRLYELLPADLRRRDVAGGQALKAVLRALESQYDLLEVNILQLRDDQSVETCRTEILAYLGDLLGFRLPRTAAGVETGSAADAARVARQASLLRRLVGGLVASRRRKGSVAEARRLAREFGHTSSYLVETVRRIDRTQAVRRPAGLGPLPGEAGPSLRGRAGPGEAIGPYERFPRTAEVRRLISRPGETPGRAHPDGLEVHLGRLDSHEIAKASAYCVESDDNPFLYLGTFDPTGGSIPLLARPLSAPGPGEAIDESHFVAPIRRRAMAARLLDYYGEGKSVQVFVDGKLFPQQNVLVADLRDDDKPGGRRFGHWDLPKGMLATGCLLIDPERGRLALPLTGQSASQPATGTSRQAWVKRGAGPRKGTPGEGPSVQVSYFTGLIGNLGGGGYARPLREVDGQESLIRVVPGTPAPPPGAGAPTYPLRLTVASLEAAINLFEDPALHPPGSRAVIELTDSATIDWKRDEVHIPKGSRLTIRAISGAWPLIWVREQDPTKAERMKFVADGPGARLVLEGLRVAGRALHLEDDLRTVIRDTTLIPGRVPPGSVEPDQPGATSLTLHGVRQGVVIVRSILGGIHVIPLQLSDPTPLVIRDSIIDAGPDGFALSGLEPVQTEHARGRREPSRGLEDPLETPYAYAALVVRRSTVFGRVRVHQFVLGVDSLLTGLVETTRRQTGCLRFCYVPFESATPTRYRCQPDLARSDLRRAMSADLRRAMSADLRRAMSAETPAVDPDSPEGRARLDALGRQLDPRFASRRWGNALYAALAAGTPPEIRNGAEDGGEFGAFHDLDLPARDLELLDRLSESVPAGVDVRLIVYPGTVS